MKSPRSTRPTKGDKYYIRKASGGYSTCIQGKPTDPNCDVLANCVGFACGFYNEQNDLGYEKYHLNCNAENFIERAIASGLSVVKEPVVGGVMVWQKGATLSGSDGAGHVAGVYAKPSDTQVKTAERGYGSSAFWTATRNKGNGNWGAGSGYTYRGCIVPLNYNPNPPTPSEDISKKSVEELAREVINGKYGNGEARKKALGSRYAEVQARVNEILAGDKPSPTPSKPDLLTMVRRTIRGDFGNYPARKTNIEKLGWDYSTVQHQVNENVKRGNWKWDNIKLY